MITPPVHTREQILPFIQLSWQHFEQLCLRLVRLDQSVEHTQPYGVQGDEQGGIDIYARHRDNDHYTVYQCKNVQDFGPAKIKDAVNVFLNGNWFKSSSFFVLCCRKSFSPKSHADEVEVQAKRLRKHNITFLIWDEGKLCDSLKSQPEIVDDFFGRPWVRAFCGHEIADSLGNRITAQQSEAALSAYYSWLTGKVGRVVYRGFANNLHNDRTVELPLDRVYVPPLFLPEDESDAHRGREREIIRQLQDPDLGKAQQSKLEEEFRTLKISDWQRSSFVWDDGWALNFPALQAQVNPVSLKDILSCSRKFVVLGAPGSGKSTLLRWLALMCVQSRLNPEQIAQLNAITDDTLLLPVLIPLAAFANGLKTQNSLTLSEFIKSHLQSLSIDNIERFYASEFEEGSCWILLDGIDEITEVEVRADVVKAIESFLAGIGNNRCLLTSRLHGYERVSGISHFHLQSLNVKQIGEFIFNWNFSLEVELNPQDFNLDQGREHGESLISQLDENENLRALSSNPLLLVALLLMHRQSQTLPQSRVEIYQAMTDTLLKTWNTWRSESRYNSGGQILTANQLRKVLAKVALWSRREKPSGILRRGELQRQFIEALQEIGINTDDFEQTAQSYLNAAVEQAGLLEERAPGIFAFWHPTFEEFLAASDLTSRPNQLLQELLLLRFDTYWREVILLAVGLIGTINDDRDTASDLVRALARTNVPLIEPILHGTLRLGIACVAANPILNRDLIQELLLELVESLTVQPYEPMAGSFLDVVAALPNFKPDDSLVEALGELAALHHSLGEVKTSVFRLLTNVAATNDRARQLCQRQFETDIDAGYPEKDVMSRFYAIIGLVRSGDINERYLTELAWHNRTINFVKEVVQLLGINDDTEATPQKPLLLEKIHIILVSPIEIRHDVARLSSEDARAILGPLAAALILLYAKHDATEIISVIKEALKPKYDLCGGVFDAAQASLLFEMGDEKVMIVLQRLSLASLRRWLQHPQAYRRIHSAEMLLNHIEKWEEQYGPVLEAIPEFASRMEEAKNEKFFEAYQIDRNLLRAESMQSLKFCLHKDDYGSRLLSADFLLKRGNVEVVCKAIEKWVKSGRNNFHPFAVMQLTSTLSKTPAGIEIVLSWMRGKNDWLRVVASSALRSHGEHKQEASEVMLNCLSLPHDEIRSALGGTLALFEKIEGKSLSPIIEEALRSCLGSEQGDASRNAAAVLYRSGFREEKLLTHLAYYMTTQEVGERFDTLRAFQEHDTAIVFLEGLAENIGYQNPAIQAVLGKVHGEEALNEKDVFLLRSLVNRQENEDHDAYFCRRCIYDWIWFNVESKSSSSLNF